MSHKYPVQKLRRILLCRSYIALLPGERERRIIVKNYQVIKRSGSITAFDLHKISAAIEKSLLCQEPAVRFLCDRSADASCNGGF